MRSHAFCDATDDEVRDVSGITHAHHVSYETCVEFVHVLREAGGEVRVFNPPRFLPFRPSMVSLLCLF